MCVFFFLFSASPALNSAVSYLQSLSANTSSQPLTADQIAQAAAAAAASIVAASDYSSHDMTPSAAAASAHTSNSQQQQTQTRSRQMATQDMTHSTNAMCINSSHDSSNSTGQVEDDQNDEDEDLYESDGSVEEFTILGE